MKSIQKLTTQGAISLCVLLALNACKPDNVVEAPNHPCGDYIKPYAKFNNNITDTIYLPIGYFSIYSPFTFEKKYTSKWYINSNFFIQNMNTFNIVLNTDTLKHNQKFTIKHLLTWKEKSVCNPNSETKDSAEISFRITRHYNDLNIIGLYRMIYDTLGAPAKQDSIDVCFFLPKQLMNMILKYYMTPPFLIYHQRMVI